MMKTILWKLRMNAFSIKCRHTETQMQTHVKWGEGRGERHKINKLYKVGRPKIENGKEHIRGKINRISVWVKNGCEMPSILFILFSVALLGTDIFKLGARWRPLPLRLAPSHVSNALHPAQKLEFIHNISWQISLWGAWPVPWFPGCKSYSC